MNELLAGPVIPGELKTDRDSDLASVRFGEGATTTATLLGERSVTSPDGLVSLDTNFELPAPVAQAAPVKKAPEASEPAKYVHPFITSALNEF